MVKKGTEAAAELSKPCSQDSTDQPPPSPTAVTGEDGVEIQTMAAIVLSCFGGLKNVKVGKRHVPNPTPTEGTVNVKVIMSGINFQDVMARLGVMESPPTPFVMGSECVGTVTAVGEGVTSLKVNDTVFCLPENGAWAEELNVPEIFVWRVGQTIPTEKLACTLPYLVAELLLGDSIRPESTILVHSAGGSVGLAVKELAKGCNVIGITSKGKMEKLEGFKTLIERGTDYVGEIRKTYPSGVDLVLDPQGGEDCARGISLLAPGGKYVLFGSANIVTGETKSFFTVAKSWWQVEKVSPLKLYEENKSIGGLHLRHLLKSGKKEYIGEKLEKIWKLMADGKLQPIVDSTLNFREVTDGMSKLHERKNIGKILLSFEDVPKENEG